MCSAFQHWHQYLKGEVANKRLSHAVFTPNNHYLTHIGYMTRRMGNLRAYSARSMERSIGRYAKLIKSKVYAGANANNVVERLNMIGQINREIDINKVLGLIQPVKTSLDDFLELDEASQYSNQHQLWSPFSKQFSLTSNLMVEDIPVPLFLDKLKAFYKRSLALPEDVVISNMHVDIAARALLGSHVYSSQMNRRIRSESRRGNHYVLFNATIRK